MAALSLEILIRLGGNLCGGLSPYDATLQALCGRAVANWAGPKNKLSTTRPAPLALMGSILQSISLFPRFLSLFNGS